MRKRRGYDLYPNAPIYRAPETDLFGSLADVSIRHIVSYLEKGALGVFLCCGNKRLNALARQVAVRVCTSEAELNSCAIDVLSHSEDSDAVSQPRILDLRMPDEEVSNSLVTLNQVCPRATRVRMRKG
jgi:hypothetical protein